MGGRSGALDQVPAIAEGIAPDGHRAIGFVARRVFEYCAGGGEAGVVAREITGVEEEPDAACALCADGAALVVTVRTGEDEFGTAAGGQTVTQRLWP